MTVQFDTLSFAKRLTAAGEKVEVAEAHAMALKEFVMDTIATKADISEARTELRAGLGEVRSEVSELRSELRAGLGEVRTEMGTEIGKVRTEMGAEFGKVRTEMGAEFGKVRTEMGDLRTELKFDIAGCEEKLRREMTLMRDDLRKDIDTLGLKLTIRMGGMLVVAIGVLASLRRFV